MYDISLILEYFKENGSLSFRNKHMKKFTRSLSLILVLLMLFATVAPCISAADATQELMARMKKQARAKDDEPIYTRDYSFQNPDKAAANDYNLYEKEYSSGKSLYKIYEVLTTQIKNKQSGYNFGSSSASIGKVSEADWYVSSTNTTLPKLSSQHPRLLVTKDTIPQIRKALEEDNPTNERFFALLEMDITQPRVMTSSTIPATPVKRVNGVLVANGGINKGQLGAATDGFFKRAGLHNYDGYYLEVIQAKALGYLIDGHEYYGYQAIQCMKQFIRTLDIQKINSNQEREYGNAMFTAALVYDWCYDLLTADDKEQLIAGVENKLARGKNGAGTANKFQLGFPPTKLQPISGHGSERQVLRDMLSAAVAFYGDNNSWWNYIGKLFYERYVPVRNYYFESGISQQGVGTYVSGRHIGDMFSAWIMLTSAGKQPYDKIHTTIRNFLGYETTPGLIYTDGDGGGDRFQQDNYEFRAMAYMTAYLFEDEPMLAQARSMKPTTAFGSDMRIDITIELQSPLYVALTGMSDITPAANKYEGMPLIQYNGSPVGQYVTHEAYGVTDSASVFMKVKERTTANHEHSDAGNFMIYYKGILTADTGWYDQYGSMHNKYYHQATVSHNSLLVYNPNKPNLSGNDAKYYSGGQRWPAEGQELSTLMSDSGTYATGIIMGQEHGYYDVDETKPKYAYLNGNITKAYEASTVNYVGRRMLVVYTGDETVPMAFFTYDRIEADSATYKKTFLFHICSYQKPTVDTTKKTIKTENGGGQLVLTCLSSDVAFDTSKGGGTGNNYYVNDTVGHVDTPNGYDDTSWGRVEITNTNSGKTSSFFNAMYVTDAGNTTDYQTKPITNVSTNLTAGDVEGGVFNDSIAVVFYKRNIQNNTLYNAATTSFTTTGTKTLQYYVDGMAAGTWNVKVNGTNIGSFPVTQQGRILTFDAPAGNVVLTWEGSLSDTSSLSSKRTALYNALGEKRNNPDGIYTADSYAAYCAAYDEIKNKICMAADISALNAINVTSLLATAEGKLVDELVLKRNELKAQLGDKKSSSGYTSASYKAYSSAYDAILTSINSAKTIEDLESINVATLKAAAEAKLASSLEETRAALLTALGSKKSNTEYTQSSYSEYSSVYDSIKSSITNATTVEALNNIDVPTQKAAAEAKLVTLVDAKKTELLTALGTKKAKTSDYSDDAYAEYSRKYDEILAYINDSDTLVTLNAIDVTAQILSAESGLVTTLDAKKEYLIDALGAKMSGSGTNYTAYSNAYDAILASINNATTAEELDALDIPAAKAEAENKMVTSLSDGKAVLLAALGEKLPSSGYTTASYTQYSNAYDALLSSINSVSTMEELKAIEFVELKTAAMSALKKSPANSSTSNLTGDGASAETDVYFSYEAITNAEIFKIDITWTDLAFTYTEATTLWDPSTHSYQTITDPVWNDASGSIKVVNHSNAAVKVTMTITKASGETATLTLGSTSLSSTSFTLLSAVNTAVASAPNNTVTITAGGTPIGKTTMGTVRVTITKSTT